MTVALALVASPLLAEGANTAAAESLFQEGRALFQAERYAEGCPKLAESHRLAPATGTLLALALCHESEGRLASAWAEFTAVEGRARRDGRVDREELAREHAAALRPRLSTLTVDVPGDVATTPGLEVRLNGAVVGTASFGIAVPVDGGEHRIEVSATGKQAWNTVAHVNAESHVVRVSVPPLAERSTANVTAPAATSAASNATDAPPSTVSGTTMRNVGLVTAGAGVVALGIGSYLALDAKSDYENARDDCDGTACTQKPYEETQSARSQGTTATVFLVVGGAAVAAGAALWLVAPSAKKRQVGGATALRVERVGLGPRGLVLRGKF
jgi:hypothetical protein